MVQSEEGKCQIGYARCGSSRPSWTSSVVFCATTRYDLQRLETAIRGRPAKPNQGRVRRCAHESNPREMVTTCVREVPAR
jgi:hypothetical protein